MTAKLYVVPASHPCAAVIKALELKGIEFTQVQLVPVVHKAIVKARFGGSPSVPAIKLDDGRKIVGSKQILRALDALRPEPRLYPGDARVEQAEAWGEEILQAVSRRLLWAALSNDKAAFMTYAEGARLVPPTPDFAARASSPVVLAAERRLWGVTPDRTRADLAELPGLLDVADAYVADGTIGGEQPTAADLHIAAGLRLMQTVDDLAAIIDPRPSGELARRVFPQYPGHVGPGALSV